MQKISALLLAIFILLSASLPGRCQAYSSSTTTLKNNLKVTGSETISGTVNDTGETVNGPISATSLTVNGVPITGGITSITVTPPPGETVTPPTLTSNGTFAFTRNVQYPCMFLGSYNQQSSVATASYDLIAPTFQTYDRTALMGGSGGARPLPGPALTTAPVITHGGTTGSTSYSYSVIAMDGSGNLTSPSPVGTTATGNATLSGTNTNILTWTAVPGDTVYLVYRTASSGTPATVGFLGYVYTTTYTDSAAIANPLGAPPACTITGDYYNNSNWVQSYPISSTNCRIYSSGTLTFNNTWTVLPEVSSGKSGTAAGFGGGLSFAQNGAGGSYGGLGGASGYGTGSYPPGGIYPISMGLSGSAGAAGFGAGIPSTVLGGSGGGSLYIDCTNNITFASGTNLTLNGGNGVTSATSTTTSGGGGSGGGFQIRSLGTITAATGASITANGGTGGNAPTSGFAGGGGGGGIIDWAAPTISLYVIPVVNGGSAGTGGATAGTAGAVGIFNNNVSNANVPGPRSAP